MTDILRVFSKFKLLEPGDLSVSLVEVSPHLTRIQEEKICGRTTDPVKEYILLLQNSVEILFKI